MTTIFEYLCLRRPRLDYVCPPFCENDFSGSGGPVIELDPFGRLRGPTGLILSGEGGLTLSWDDYPGALCFNIYQAVDENNPDGEYVIIAECVEGPPFQIPSSGPRFFKVSAITPEGESELSDSVERTGGGGGCTVQIDDVTLNLSVFRRALSNNGMVAGIFGGNRPGYYLNGISKDIRTEVNSAPITASQFTNTVTADAPFFNPGDINKVIRFSTLEEAQITNVLSNLQVTVTPSQTVASTTFVLRGATLGGAIGDATVSNASGIVAGQEQTFAGGGTHAFWLDTNSNNIRDLGATRVVYDININNYLLIDDLTLGSHHTLIYNPNTGSFTDIGLIEPGSQTTPRQFNDGLTVAVTCVVSGVPNACRWSAGVFTNIHPAEAVAEPSDSVAINSLGHIVGTYIDPAAFFDNKTFINTGGASLSIAGGLGEIIGNDINDSDMIVGTRESGSQFVPFFWTPAGGVQNIPLLPGTISGEAFAVNNVGWVVGDMRNAGNFPTAFIYKDGVTSALFDLLPPGTGWTSLDTASHVNNNKQIVGFGSHPTLGPAYIVTLC